MTYFINKTLIACLLIITGLITLNSNISANENIDFLGPTNATPVESPDGGIIAFSSNAGADGSYDIWLLNLGESSIQTLTQFDEISDEKYPDWFPDGQTIVFSSNREDIFFNIWTIDINTLALKQLTTGTSNNTQPRISPDGSKILFISNRTGKNEIWTMDIDGSNQKEVGLQSRRVSDPAWSPDGNRIVYVGCDNKSCNLFQIALDGSQPKQITNGEFQDWMPDWSDAGIIFSSDRDESQTIWIVQSDGTGLNLLNPLLSGILQPRWISDGNIIFSRSDPSDSLATSQIWLSNITGDVTEKLTNINSFSYSSLTVDAGPDQTVFKGEIIALNGSASNSTNDPSSLNFSWQQKEGPSVLLEGENTVSPSFTPTEVGKYIFTLTVSDGISSKSDDVIITVLYKFLGFFKPLDNLPASNKVKAGSSVPIKFSLNGDQGMSILEGSNPVSKQILCENTLASNMLEETATAGNSGLNYDPLSDTYNYIWKTDPSWVGTCRELEFKLIDGSSHTAIFNFFK